MTDNQESFIIESSQNMKKNDKESFIGTGQNLKDEESSNTTDITDALEMDVEMDMDMKKKEDGSFGTEKNLKDAESIRTGITDALEIDMEMEMDMKKKEDESFGTETNLKDEESSITTDITDALEMDVEMDMGIFVTLCSFFLFIFFIYYRLLKIGSPYLVMVLMAIIIPLCCFCFSKARCYDKRTTTITEPND